MNAIHNMFGRINAAGNVDVLFADSGEAVTRIDANIYPVGSSLSTRYEHANGIELTVQDAKNLDLEIEN